MNQAISELNIALDEIIVKKEVPGIVMGIVDRNGTKYTYSGGKAHIGKDLNIQDDTLFDLASLTKVVATLPSIIKLLQNNELALNHTISKFFPKINFHNLTIKNLLQHTTQLPASYPFFKGKIVDKNDVVEKIASFSTEQKVGQKVIYSDLNFIMLGFIVEKVSGLSLDEFATKEIFKPLGMNNTVFNPSAKLLDTIAATEYRHEIQKYDHGYVHDENAKFFGGVAGHAGLFSNLQDLIKFAQMIISPSNYQVLSNEIIDLSITTRTTSNLARGLGWQLNDQKTAGEAFPLHSFGHTGFTGTSIWFDEHRQFAVIILTNRVHFGRERTIGSLRQRLHTIAYRSLNKK